MQPKHHIRCCIVVFVQGKIKKTTLPYPYGIRWRRSWIILYPAHAKSQKGLDEPTFVLAPKMNAAKLYGNTAGYLATPEQQPFFILPALPRCTIIAPIVYVAEFQHNTHISAIQYIWPQVVFKNRPQFVSKKCFSGILRKNTRMKYESSPCIEPPAPTERDV